MTPTSATIQFSDHACDRIRGRLRLAATEEQLDRFRDTGRIVSTAPRGVFAGGAPGIDAFLVTHEAVFALGRVAPNTYVAITCVRRPRLSKADRRARRDAARAERDWSTGDWSGAA